MAQDEPGVEIPLVYIGADDEPVLFANQFVVQHELLDEFVLTLGQLTAPILLGSEEEKMEQASRLAYVPVKVVGRFSFTRERVVELINALKENLETYDRRKERQGK